MLGPAMGSEAAIAVDGLRVRRGGNPVLHGLSFSVRRGRVTGLMGPSGCGKTTLMRAIVGVQIVEAGTVEVLGEAAGSAALRPRVGYVTQAPSVYGDLSVRENLRYFARVLGAPLERIEATIATVALGEQADQVVDSLSGGQQARVSLATALLGEPDLLVLDEPTVGLDPVLRASLWEVFAQLAAGGTTLLVSSHVMDEAEHCEGLLLLREGRIAFEGTPQDLRERTGSDDLEVAFLRLIESGAGAG
jgi:ABC-2 type transport system ATP-binding protein